MNPRRIHGIGILLSFGVFLSSSTWAGEVVTPDLKAWARTVIQEEKALKAPPAKNSVAVLYFKNQTGRPDFDPLQKGITLMLLTDLSKVKSLQVVERVKLQALGEEMGLGASGLVDPQTAPRAGRLLGAQWLVGGEISARHTILEIQKLRLQSRLLDVPVERIIGQPAAEGEVAQLFRLEKELLFELIRLLKIELTVQEEQELRIPCSTSFQALHALFRAIEASDRGEYSKAGQLYETALMEDGRICIAREALRELQILGLVEGKKKSRDVLWSLRDQTSLTDRLSPEDTTKRVKSPQEIPTPAQIGITFP